MLVPGVIVYKIRDSSDSCPRHLRINSCLQASGVNSRKCLGLGLRLQNEIKNANMISGPWQVHLQAIKHNGTRWPSIRYLFFISTLEKNIATISLPTEGLWYLSSITWCFIWFMFKLCRCGRCQGSAFLMKIVNI